MVLRNHDITTAGQNPENFDMKHIAMKTSNIASQLQGNKILNLRFSLQLKLKSRCSGLWFLEDGSSNVIRNIGILPEPCTVSQPRTHIFTPLSLRGL